MMKKLNTPQYFCYGLDILILSLDISFTIQSHFERFSVKNVVEKVKIFPYEQRER